MVISPDISSKLAIDAKSLDDLQVLAKKDPDEALRKAAQQFEALFLNMLLKSMREATPKDGLLDSQQTQFYTQMYDQQLTQHLSVKGIGIADIMVQQLSRANQADNSQTQTGLNAMNPASSEILIRDGHPNDKSDQLWSVNRQHAAIPSASDNAMEKAGGVVVKVDQLAVSAGKPNNDPADFIDKLLPHAKSVSQAVGIPAQFMLAQAALESGWGKHEIRRADNSPSYNLFGIKAGANWKGDVVETVTTEFINGVPQKMVEKFRAYGSYAEGFSDYAKLLSDNPRYAKVVNASDASAFAFGLQRAGYATDPRYAEKLLRILKSDSLQGREFI
ncbi:MAG: flagellar assembly peptidoglycan hydrolase FlgJ [Nitrosomonas sp.]|nr:MAG: flagellar assembly peptidoglycan hydrolase FlgJ [Nitrosomonas sp.]